MSCLIMLMEVLSHSMSLANPLFVSRIASSVKNGETRYRNGANPMNFIISMLDVESVILSSSSPIAERTLAIHLRERIVHRPDLPARSGQQSRGPLLFASIVQHLSHRYVWDRSLRVSVRDRSIHYGRHGRRSFLVHHVERLPRHVEVDRQEERAVDDAVDRAELVRGVERVVAVVVAVKPVVLGVVEVLVERTVVLGIYLVRPVVDNLYRLGEVGGENEQLRDWRASLEREGNWISRRGDPSKGSGCDS